MAAGDIASVKAAEGLVAEVLAAPLFQAAVQLDQLLRSGSPLAMVKAVDLAERLLDGVAVDNEVPAAEGRRR